MVLRHSVVISSFALNTRTDLNRVFDTVNVSFGYHTPDTITNGLPTVTTTYPQFKHNRIRLQCGRQPSNNCSIENRLSIRSS